MDPPDEVQQTTPAPGLSTEEEMETGEVTSSSEEDDDDTDDCLLEDFIFTTVGQNVAVFYDDDFHIGSVAKIASPEKAEINFLRKCAVTSNTFVWPNKTDSAMVQSIFVFASDFHIECKTTTGRAWSVPNYKELCLKYAAYKAKYA